jgi:hypothetical protein
VLAVTRSEAAAGSAEIQFCSASHPQIADLDVILISNYPRGSDADFDFKKLDIGGYPVNLQTV